MGGGGLVSRGRVVGSGGMVGGGMDGDVGGGVVGSGVLLLVVVLVDLIGSSSRLAHNPGGVAAVGLVDGGGDSGGIAQLGALVGVLVSTGGGQDGKDGNKDLQYVEVVC